MDDPPKKPRRIEISLTQLIAGSAAAACGAWLSSKIGLAGTVIGAAIVSALVTLLSAVYAHGVRRAREELLVRAEVLRHRPRLPASYADPGDEPTSDADLGDEPADANETTSPLLLPPFDLEDQQGYRWGRIALAFLAVFVVAMLVVTGIELINGHSFQCSSSGTNCDQGTTLIPGIKHAKPSRTPTPIPTPTPTPTATSTSTSPTSSGTASPTTTLSGTTTPSATGTTTTTASPTGTSTATPTP